MEDDEEIDQDFKESNVPPQDIPMSTSTEDQENYVILKWIVALISLFQSKFSVSSAAISWLLKFLYGLLRLLGNFCPRVSAIASCLPRSIYQFKRSKLHPECEVFDNYCVCNKCNSLYSPSECETIKKCSYKQHHNARRCGEALFKEIVSANGSKRQHPHKIYCISRLSSSLQNLILKPGFIEKCESTRNAFSNSRLSDVYDGEIWRHFQVIDQQPFLSAPNNYGLLLNIDWLQPFDHTQYSVGVIFLVVLNLPRSIRFKRENVILYGVIPGPSEPSLHINSFLSPLVSDLLDLWQGIQFRIPNSTSKMTFRCALLGVACDLPAAKKTCGFLSHSATLGCSKCYYRFFDGHGHSDYGGDFTREQWVMRSHVKHRESIKIICSCSTLTSRSKAELEHGCRYSALLDLPYFDPIKMLMIDPMHNLFMGTAKHFFFNILIGRGILNKAALETIKSRLRSATVPSGLGRLPTSINTGTFLTAEQWMNWTLYFSIYCLHDLIRKDYIECWRHFVLASSKLCQYSVTQDDLSVADALLLRFCKRVKCLFGSDALTPNMHMHCHLVTCLRDFGPLHSFWLFPFERYNGILGTQPTNNRSVEVQLMRRFHIDNANFNYSHNMPHSNYFEDLVGNYNTATSNTGNDVKLGSKYLVATFSNEFQAVLKKLYVNLYPELKEQILSGSIHVSTIFKKYPFIIKNGQHIDTLMRRVTKNPYVIASPVFDFPSCQSEPTQTRPAKLHYFVKHSIILPGLSEPQVHIFGVVSWPLIHPQHSVYGKPVQVWCHEIYETMSDNIFIPLDNIKKRLIICSDEVAGEKVLTVIPLLND